MKKFYYKVTVGVISFGLFFIVDPSFLTALNSILWYLICFLLPIFLFRHIVIKIWMILYGFYILSNIYIKLVPPTFNGSCWSFCGGDSRKETMFIIYFIGLIILTIWQLVSFINKRNLEKDKKSPVPTVM
jgi:hypothetical protein